MSDKRSRLTGLGAIHLTGNQPARELHVTFSPGKEAPSWYVAATFEKGLTVTETAERLRGLADLLMVGEDAHGHPVLTVGGS